MIRRPPRSTLDRSSAASDVYKRQAQLPYIAAIYALRDFFRVYDLHAHRWQRPRLAELDLAGQHAAADRGPRECHTLANHEQRDRALRSEHRMALRDVDVN